MGFKEKFKSFFDLEENNDINQLEQRQPEQSQKDNVVSIKAIQNDTKMVLFELTSYDETQTVADHLKKKKSVVINIERLDQLTSRRVIDFLSGTVYGINGNIQKLGHQIFLCTPENVHISGSISDFVVEEDFSKR